MLASEMITKFENLVDDESLDGDFVLQLLNDAKNEIEGDRIWEQLKYLDSSQTRTIGDTSANTKALPTRLALPIQLYVGQEDEPYSLINFEDQIKDRSNTKAFFIDLANNVFAFTGTAGKTDTIYFFHTKYTADLGTSDTWVFPSRFHSIIPLKMAQMYYAVDGGEKARAWDDRWAKYYQNLYNLMIQWDAMLKMRAKSFRGSLARLSPLVAFN